VAIPGLPSVFLEDVSADVRLTERLLKTMSESLCIDIVVERWLTVIREHLVAEERPQHVLFMP
jgi:hypothetical protein